MIRELLREGNRPKEIAEACDASGWGETCKNHLPQIYRIMKETPIFKRPQEGSPVNLVLRVSDVDAQRLETLAAALPVLGKTGLAREALRCGLDLFDAAMKEPKEEARLVALARLCGMESGHWLRHRPRSRPQGSTWMSPGSGGGTDRILFTPSPRRLSTSPICLRAGRGS